MIFFFWVFSLANKGEYEYIHYSIQLLIVFGGLKLKLKIACFLDEFEVLLFPDRHYNSIAFINPDKK